MGDVIHSMMRISTFDCTLNKIFSIDCFFIFHVVAFRQMERSTDRLEGGLTIYGSDSTGFVQT